MLHRPNTGPPRFAPPPPPPSPNPDRTRGCRPQEHLSEIGCVLSPWLSIYYTYSRGVPTSQTNPDLVLLKILETRLSHECLTKNGGDECEDGTVTGVDQSYFNKHFTCYPPRKQWNTKAFDSYNKNSREVNHKVKVWLPPPPPRLIFITTIKHSQAILVLY